MPTSSQDRLRVLFGDRIVTPKPSSSDNESRETERPSSKISDQGQAADVQMAVHRDDTETTAEDGNRSTAEATEYSVSLDLQQRLAVKDWQSECSKSQNWIRFLPSGKHRVPHKEPEAFHRITLKEHDDDGSPSTGHFCVLSRLLKFPHKYLIDQEAVVYKEYFAAGKIYEREWDLYLLTAPKSLDHASIFFVPFTQVNKLMQEIRAKCGVGVCVPPYPFTFSFFHDGTPQPIFVGKANSREQMDAYKTRKPTVSPMYGECPSDASSMLSNAFERYTTRCKRALGGNDTSSTVSTPTSRPSRTPASKNSKKERKAKDHAQNLATNRRQLRRLQDYFGLRTTPLDEVMGAGQEPILISIDVESHEMNHEVVMEVGVSTLDTADLIGIPPGKMGENWVKQIRSRHFRIEEYKNLVNHVYVHGDPQGFRFGKSEWVKMDDAAAMIDRCFVWPFSAGFKCEGPRQYGDNSDGGAPSPSGGTPLGGDPSLFRSGKLCFDRTRANAPLIVVGHDVQQDLRYLHKMGSKIFGKGGALRVTPADLVQGHQGDDVFNGTRVVQSIKDFLDTSVLFKTWKGARTITSLGNVCLAFDILTYDLHNSGNDARYTLEALIALAITASEERATRVDDVSETHRDEPDLLVPVADVPVEKAAVNNDETDEEPY